MVLTSSLTERKPPKHGSPTSPDGPSCGRSHLNDLRRIRLSENWSASFAFWAKRSVPISFFFFLVQNISSWIFSLIFSPMTILADPIGTVASLVIYPVVWTALGVVVFVFWILALFRGQKIIDWLGKRYAQGYSMVNWPNPQIFGPSSLRAVQEAREYLTGDNLTTFAQEIAIEVENPDFTTMKTVRVFSLPLARAFLLMSALVYERSDRLVRQASDIAFRAQKYEPGSPTYEKEMNRAEEALEESERVIKDKAKEWGLEYDGVSDLQTIGGPFASIFYTPFGSSDKPFVCLVFKGTSPSDFSEFLVDATIARVGAGAFYGQGSGTAHRGFYTSLFPMNDGAITSGDGYGSILRTLKHVAARMKREWPGQETVIPLWVAGHSLGSALASLCYARMLRQPQDLGEDLVLKDCYSFGTPRLGDGNFATAFESNLISTLDRPNILWRVGNHSDIVTRIPPGLADRESSRSFLPTQSVLNYAYLGPCIRLFPTSLPLLHRPPWYAVEQEGAFHEATEVRVMDHEPRIERGGGGGTGGDGKGGKGHGTMGEGWDHAKRRSARWRSVDESEGKNPLRWALAALPGFVYDHFPNSYLQHLNNLETSAEQAAREAAERERRRTDPRGAKGGIGVELKGRVG
ncbi:hypothetical protein JCM11251_002783 [Rhodosporidiobolus azoricus]